MFTGIVKEIGQVTGITQQANALQLAFHCSIITEDVAIGDSISVNGVCLTVTSYTDHGFTADAMPETFRNTSLASLKQGSTVNLEPALQPISRMGGHIVSGHVDTTGIIQRTYQEANAKYYEIAVSEGTQYVTEKGSVAVDGISLTVFRVTDNAFTISLIPETQRATTLGQKQAGDTVNVEYDVLAKYMERLLEGRHSKQKQSGITEQTLEKYGFLD